MRELRVPENPEYSKGRSIPIYVVVIPALSAAPHPDPWVEISGGPGNAATDYARDYAGTGVSGAYRKDRDVLLAGGADLSQYSSARAADDLEAVRIWLGYPQLNLWGYSYGTRSVLTYMDRYPASVRSAVLWGVVPPDYRRPLFYARDSQRALDRSLADCLADKLCAGAFPRVRGTGYGTGGGCRWFTRRTSRTPRTRGTSVRALRR